MKKYCIFAGGCFWCIAAPFYEIKGVKKVISGYSGGDVVNPTYEEVKSQTTGHFEVIKIIYDEEFVSYKELLNVYFENIDLFDDGGQFIDRGDSYKTAIFYHDLKMFNIASAELDTLNKIHNNRVKVLLLEEKEFYKAIEYHQDYCLKKPKEFLEELIISGRKVKK